MSIDPKVFNQPLLKIAVSSQDWNKEKPLSYLPSIKFPTFRKRYFFYNGYGISVIRHEGSYGREQGQFEVAVLIGDQDSSSICYDTEITDDVIGHLEAEEVLKIGKRVAKLREAKGE